VRGSLIDFHPVSILIPLAIKPSKIYIEHSSPNVTMLDTDYRTYIRHHHIESNYVRCRRCGKWDDLSYHRCSARTARCNRCYNFGHFSRCCVTQIQQWGSPMIQHNDRHFICTLGPIAHTKSEKQLSRDRRRITEYNERRYHASLLPFSSVKEGKLFGCIGDRSQNLHEQIRSLKIKLHNAQRSCGEVVSKDVCAARRDEVVYDISICNSADCDTDDDFESVSGNNEPLVSNDEEIKHLNDCLLLEKKNNADMQSCYEKLIVGMRSYTQELLEKNCHLEQEAASTLQRNSEDSLPKTDNSDSDSTEPFFHQSTSNSDTDAWCIILDA